MSRKKSRGRRAASAGATAPAAGPRRERWLLAGVLLLAAALYARTLAAGFIAFDDPTVVAENPYIRELGLANLARWFTTPVQYMYMPLALFSYAVDYRIAKLEPWIYHLDNLVLHLACVALVFWVFRLLTGRPRVALLVALLFAVHPVNADTVSSVAARTSLLAALFGLVALGCYGLYLEEGERLRYLALSLAAFVLAALARSSAVVLPVLLLLWDGFRGRGLRWRLLLEKLPFFAVALGFGLLALAMRKDDVLPPVHYGAADRVLLFLYALAHYVIRLVLPLRLSLAYAYPVKVGPWLPPAYYLAPVLLVLVVWGLARLGVARRVLVFGLSFFVVNVALSQSVLLIDGFMANRYAYLAYLGLFLVLAELAVVLWNAAAGRRRALRAALVTGLAVMVAGFGAATWARTLVWRDSLTLLDDVAAKQPGMPWVYGTRGLVELHARDLAAARRDLDEALRLDPRYTPGLLYRGVVNSLEQRYPAALADLSEALSIDPRVSGGWRDRGKVKLALQDEAGALEDFTRAIELDPRSEARFWRAALEHERGDDRAALADLDLVVAGDPGDAEAFVLRAMVRTRQGDVGAACADLAHARGLGYQPPDDPALPRCP